MILVRDLPLLLSLTHALLGYKHTPLEEALPVRVRFPDFFLLWSGTSCRAGACLSSLRRPLPPSFAISPETQQSLWYLESRTNLSGRISLRIDHMRALLSPGDPSPALGVGIMPASSLMLCASACRLRKASPSLVKSIPCGLCMDFMNGLAAGVYGQRSPPAASRTSPRSSQVFSLIFVPTET